MEDQQALAPRPLNERNWFEYFRDVYLGFGPPEDLVRRCVRRAYLDFNRTWHGARDLSGQRQKSRGEAEKSIIRALHQIADRNVDQDCFDKWHKSSRDEVMYVSDPAARGSGLTLGQAQKWINMSVKYIVGSGVSDFSSLGPVAHVPIDRVLLDALEREPKFAPARKLIPAGAWSKLSNAEVYDAFQREMRQLSAPLPPLVREFWLWRAEMKRRTG